MAIVDVIEVWDGRSGTVNDRRERDYVRVFKVTTSTPSAGPETIRAASGIPRLFSPFLSTTVADLGSWCREVRCRQDSADPYLWHVEAQYSSRIERPDLNQDQPPQFRPPEISWSTVGVNRVAWEDRDGNPVVNVNNERFDPPIEIEEKRLVLKVAKNVLFFNPAALVAYKGAVNSDAWIGFQPGRARCVDLSATREFESGLYYWRLSGEFHFRLHPAEARNVNPVGVAGREEGNVLDVNNVESSLNAWAIRVLNQGFTERSVAGAEPRLARDKVTGAPMTIPVLLDADGVRLAQGAAPVFLSFHFYPALPFKFLGLP